MFKNFSMPKGAVFHIFCALSFLAGGINGFLGTGGGILFIYTLSYLTDNDKKVNFATTLVATAIISLVTVVRYAKQDMVDFSLGGALFIPCALGGVAGALLLDRIKTEWLSVIFAILVIYSGTCMIFR